MSVKPTGWLDSPPMSLADVSSSPRQSAVQAAVQQLIMSVPEGLTTNELIDRCAADSELRDTLVETNCVVDFPTAVPKALERLTDSFAIYLNSDRHCAL